MQLLVIEKNSFEIIENIRFYNIVFRNNKATNNPVAYIIYDLCLDTKTTEKIAYDLLYN